MKPITRRAWLGTVSGMAAGALLPSGAADAPPRRYRAAIFGQTGRGDYGHALDLVFQHRSDVEVVAVSDPDPAGRSKARERTGAARAYADYRELLAAERPDLVSVAPRWTEGRFELVRAALEAGAHVYVEKPFATTLEEADRLVQLARAGGRRLAVAHQMRLAPAITSLQAHWETVVGRLLEIRAWGKQDHRAGGEDLMVLGTHLFDLIRLFAGDPESCTAQVLQEGREIRREDARPATEQIGPVAGDTLYAQFLLPGGVQASFTSRKELRALAGHWGLELLGTAGAVRVLADLSPAVHVARPGPWTRDGRELAWRRWEGDPTRDAPENGAVAANRRMVDQWIRSIEENGKPICSGEDGRWALEMAHAVYASSLSGRRVRFPLAGRGHPLAGEG